MTYLVRPNMDTRHHVFTLTKDCNEHIGAHSRKALSMDNCLLQSALSF